ncbi:MAG: ribosomal-processing cysteine protease Prp [Pseudobutyrivibrio sp.]|nr:ribosomal-processing cysteine protease Prp [Pseudobutyrivibrio sp.]
MISVVITKQDDRYIGVALDGHAGYADEGQDIVCAAVSVLVINTFNSIERFTDDDFSCEAAEDGGYMTMSFSEDVSDKTKLLLDSMLLGLDEIQKQYGDEYLSLLYKEV